MIIRHLRVKNLKLLRDFELSFVDDAGKPRMWTVLIGENGTARTSLLQAIALAAAGSLEVNSLAKRITGQLRDRRQNGPMEAIATFGFLDLPKRARRVFPGLNGGERRDSDVQVRSTVTLAKDSSSLRARSEYLSPFQGDVGPLDVARDKNLAHWFVAGYGIARALPDASKVPVLEQPSIERMEALFDSQVALTSTAFANYFNRQEKGNRYSQVLKSVLFHTRRLLPKISNFSLRGRGGVKKAGDLVEGNRFRQQIYREYFGIDDIIPDESGRKLRDYRYLAANPYRTDGDDRELARLRAALEKAGIDPAFEPVPRSS